MLKLTEFPADKEGISLANRGKLLCWIAQQRPKGTIEKYYFKDGTSDTRAEAYVKFNGDSAIYDYSNEARLLVANCLF